MLNWHVPEARGPHAFLTELGQPQRQSPSWRSVCGHWPKYRTLCMVTPCQEDGCSDFIHRSSLGLFPLERILVDTAPLPRQGPPVILFKPVPNIREIG